MQRERDDREGGGAPRRSGGLGRYLALSGAIWRYLAISFYLILFRVDLTKESARLQVLALVFHNTLGPRSGTAHQMRQEG